MLLSRGFILDGSKLKSYTTHLSIVFLLLLFLSPLACRKKTAPAPETTEAAAPQIVKIVLPVSQLAGLQINDREVESIAGLSDDLNSLSGADLGQAFDIQDSDYQEQVLELIQSQLQSGSPLKDVLIYLGRLPKKYAAQCVPSETANATDETCLIQPLAFYCGEALKPQNWTAENYQALCHSLGRLKAYKADYLVTLFDGDNTLWYQDVSNAGVKRGVAAKRVQWGLGKAELLPVYPEVEVREAYLKEKTPYDYYKELYKKVGPLWNYNYAALAFRGLSLQETFTNFEEFIQEPYGPIAFPEMQALLSYLNKEGIVTGVVSASPLFGVIPMVESMNTGIPLSRIEGLDVFLKDPEVPESLPVRLSRLINQGKYNETSGQVEEFKNYAEVLAQYGTWMIVDVDHVINARGGKGVQSRSIIRRHVAAINQEALNAKTQIDLEDMRLVLIGGDNFAPATDVLNPKGERSQAALESGNDQGLSEGMNFLEKSETPGQVPGGTDLLFVSRQVLTAEGLIEAKKGKLENFKAYAAQQQLLRPNSLGKSIIQPAITDVKSEGGKGGFLKTPPPPPVSETPETTPTETAPTENPQTAPSDATQEGIEEPTAKDAIQKTTGTGNQEDKAKVITGTTEPKSAIPPIDPNPEAKAIEVGNEAEAKNTPAPKPASDNDAE